MLTGKQTKEQWYIYRGILNILRGSWKERADETITMKKVTRGLIRQSDHQGKTRTGITHNAYTDIQLGLGNSEFENVY